MGRREGRKEGGAGHGAKHNFESGMDTASAWCEFESDVAVGTRVAAENKQGGLVGLKGGDEGLDDAVYLR